MKKKLTRLYSIFWACLAGYLFLSFSSNPPNGRTGSPPTFTTCASATGGCHSGGSFNGSISITGLPGTITPSTTYQITVTLSQPTPFAEFGGFQLNVLDDNNNNFGTLSNPGPSSTIQSGYFEHNPAQIFTGTTITYNCDWTSPASGNTNVTMYAAGLLANGNGGTSGDETVTTMALGSMMGGGQILVDVVGTNVSCFGSSDGTATAAAMGGGGGPYTYNWSNGMSGPTIMNLAAGTYFVTATNASGMPGTGSITITQPASAVLATIVNTIDITCINPIGSATVDGTGGTPGYSFLWSNGMAGPTINVTTGGNYTVTVTDNNQCTATATAFIAEDNVLPIADAGPLMTISCANPTAVLDGTNSSSGATIFYEWTTPNGNIVNGANTATPLVDAGGTYNLIVSDAINGCTATDATSVISNINPPSVMIDPPGSLNCVTTSVTLDGSASSSGPNISYLWTTVGGNIVSGANTNTAAVDAAGTYTLTATDNSNGCGASSSVMVISNTSLPTADAGTDMSLNCNNTSVMLNGSASSSGADITYLWTTVSGNIVSGETTTMPIVDAAGTYSLIVTNSTNGCTATDAVLVTQTPALMASISSQTNVDCNGNSNGSASATASGGNGNYTYNWSNGPMIPTISGISAGTYTVTITDADNCTATAMATITEPTALTVSVTTVDESSPGAGDGTASANPMGGTGTYMYLWNTNETTQTITGLAAGTYSVTVTDENGCTQSGSGTVNNFDCSGFSATASTVNVTCNGGSDGSATATPAGGTTPYVYAWSDGQTMQTAIDLSAGNYMVTVTEDAGCQQVLMVTITEPLAVSISANTVNDPSCNGGVDGSITVSASGGNGGFTYLWSNSGMGEMISNLAAGSYTVTATDMSNCTGTLTVNLENPPLLVLNSLLIQNTICNGDSTGLATVGASGGTPNYSYEWPDGQTGPTHANLPAGDFSVTATDANGCMDTLTVTITEPDTLFVNIISTNETAVGANDGTATATPSGGAGGYIYIWGTGDTTSTITNYPPGTYCVTVTDNNGCEVVGCATINAFACAGVSTTTSGSGVSCFGGNDGTASVTPSGFADPVSYLWSNDSTTASITGLHAGTYTVTVSDVDGCSSVDDFEVGSPTALSVNTTNVTNAECPDLANGSITVAGSGGTPDYSYAWADGTNGPTNDSLANGSYEVVVTDLNGCTAVQNIDVAVDPDTELPVVVLQDITVELDSNGMVSIDASMIDNGSTDNCGIDTIIIDISTFTCADLGENTIVAAVADLSNNCAFGMATVTVVDNIAPTIECPDDISVQSTNCVEVVNYDPPVLADNCPNPIFELVSGSPPGSTFPSGTTTITLEARDASGNTSSCSFTITINNGFSSSATAVDALCNASADGEATASPIGGVPPYSYLWDDTNSQTTQTASGLPAGSYSVTVTDAAGCETIATTIVTEPAPLVITVDNVTNQTTGNMDGAIEVTITGGTGGYQFEWILNGNVISTEEDPTGLSAGDYALLVTDENGCSMETDAISVILFDNTLNPALGRFIDLYPNPATNKLFLEFDLPTNAEVSVSLFDVNGQSILTSNKDYFSKKTINLEFNDFSAGLYIVRIVVNNEVVVKRFVIN